MRCSCVFPGEQQAYFQVESSSFSGASFIETEPGPLDVARCNMGKNRCAEHAFDRAGVFADSRTDKDDLSLRVQAKNNVRYGMQYGAKA